MSSLYLHIPFCQRKCLYCAFSSFAARSDLYSPYVAAMKKELTALASIANPGPLESLFVGGGTPTVLPPEVLTGLIEHSLVLFPASGSVEITVEINPGTVDAAYLRSLLAAGVNRISLGVQSFIDRELVSLGRIHSAQQACDAVQWLKKTGFTNFSLDLMFGLPGQTVVSWRDSLEQALALEPQHLSLYQLMIEEGTPFSEDLANKRLELPKEQEILLMDEVTEELCLQAGLRQYETANYAREGCQCFHNLNYWRNGEYLACGASAVSCMAGKREKRIAEPWQYIERVNRGASVVVESESLTVEEGFRESVVIGLRMVEGVSVSQLKARYSFDIKEYYGKILEKLIDWQLVELTESHLRLTTRGRSLANVVMAELV